MLAVKGSQELCQIRHAPQVAASDGDPACDLLRRSELPGRLLRQLYDLLSPAAQQHPGLRQNDVVLAATEQLDSQLLLQLHQLAGQGGLRQMEQRRRPGDVLLPGHSQKILQRPKFHRAAPPLLPYHIMAAVGPQV